MTFPNQIKVLDHYYKIEYCEKPSDVDIFKRESLWGQVDYWTRTIRVYKTQETPNEEILNTIIHEVLHILISGMKIDDIISDKKNEEKIVHLLATGLNMFFNDNDIRGTK